MKAAFAAALKDAVVCGKTFVVLLVVFPAILLVSSGPTSDGSVSSAVALFAPLTSLLILFMVEPVDSPAPYALPVRRRDLVAGRYLFFLACITASDLASCAISLFLGLTPNLAALVLVTGICVAFASLMLPVCYAFSRNVALAVVSVFFAAVIGAVIGIAMVLEGRMPNVADGTMRLLVFGLSVGAIALCAGSFFASAKIAERRVL
jgi:hypothetical protein